MADVAEELWKLEGHLVEVSEAADWVARGTSRPGVKELAQAVRLAARGLGDVTEAMAVIERGGRAEA